MASHEWQAPPQQPQPPKRRHRARNIILGIVAAFIVLIIIGAAVGGGNKNKSTGNPAASVPSASPAASSSPSQAAAAPALPPGQAKFVAAIRAKLTAGGFSNNATDAQLAGVGATICKARAAGATQAALISAGSGAGDKSKFNMSAHKLTTTAEKDICHKYLPKPPRVLMHFSGNGIGNSAPFLVTSGTLTVHYTYDCASEGTGNFIGDIETGNQASLNSDDQSFANALGSGGSKTTHVYPEKVGSHYHVSIDSECDWSVTVKS